jgi:hypothetical protein
MAFNWDNGKIHRTWENDLIHEFIHMVYLGRCTSFIFFTFPEFDHDFIVLFPFTVQTLQYRN